MFLISTLTHAPDPRSLGRVRYPQLTLTAIYAQERGTPKDREPIDWKLLTDLPVRSRAEAIEKLAWYASRWKIEPQDLEVWL